MYPLFWLPTKVSFGVSLFCTSEFGVSPPSLTPAAVGSWRQARNCHLGVLRAEKPCTIPKVITSEKI